MESVIVNTEELKKVYEEDFNLWVEENLQLLKQKKYDQVDWDNLIEEIEDMSNSLKRSLKSHLSTILEHMYKLEHLLEYSHYDTNMFGEGGWGWKRSIKNARREINELINDNTSLLSLIGDLLQAAWKDAKTGILDFIDDLKISSKDKESLLKDIPIESPYTIEKIAEKIDELSGRKDENAFTEYLRRYGRK